MKPSLSPTLVLVVGLFVSGVVTGCTTGQDVAAGGAAQLEPVEGMTITPIAVAECENKQTQLIDAWAVAYTGSQNMGIVTVPGYRKLRANQDGQGALYSTEYQYTWNAEWSSASNNPNDNIVYTLDDGVSWGDQAAHQGVNAQFTMYAEHQADIIANAYSGHFVDPAVSVNQISIQHPSALQVWLESDFVFSEYDLLESFDHNRLWRLNTTTKCLPEEQISPPVLVLDQSSVTDQAAFVANKIPATYRATVLLPARCASTQFETVDMTITTYNQNHVFQEWRTKDNYAPIHYVVRERLAGSDSNLIEASTLNRDTHYRFFRYTSESMGQDVTALELEFKLYKRQERLVTISIDNLVFQPEPVAAYFCSYLRR